MAPAQKLGGEAERLLRVCGESVAAPSVRQPAFASNAQASHNMSIMTDVALAMEPWEHALQAWLELRAQGYSVDERRVMEEMSAISERVLRSSANSEATGNPEAVAALFGTVDEKQQPVFVALMRPQRGRVHFLYFWKAFGEAAHIANGRVNEGLVCELEIMRDRLLRKIDEQELSNSSRHKDGQDCCRLPTMALVEEVHRAGSMSGYPRFWQRASDHLSGQLKLEELTMEELSSIILVWLHDSQVWEAQQKMEAVRAENASTNPEDSAAGLTVRVHIYDVSQEEGIQRLNRVLAHKKSPLKFGGVFHAGVEVNGLEWSYGYSPDETRPGICCVEPRAHPQHHFRQTVQLRNTLLSPETIADIISELIEEYPGPDYNLLRRNCCHFADEFCQRLGVGGIPRWVHRLARIAAGIETMLQNAPKPIKDRFLGFD